MPVTPPASELHEAEPVWPTDVAVGVWAFAAFFGLLNLVEVIVRSARGDENARLSRTANVALSFGLAGSILRLSTRMRREHALGQTVTRLGTAVDELERVVRMGSEEAVKREERASIRDERMSEAAQATLTVARWALAVALVTLAATIVTLLIGL